MVPFISGCARQQLRRVVGDEGTGNGRLDPTYHALVTYRNDVERWNDLRPRQTETALTKRGHPSPRRSRPSFSKSKQMLQCPLTKMTKKKDGEVCGPKKSSRCTEGNNMRFTGATEETYIELCSLSLLACQISIDSWQHLIYRIIHFSAKTNCV